MKALFNNKLIDSQLSLSFRDRAFQFGDGLFETLHVANGTIPLVEKHMDRLARGAKMLYLNLPKWLHTQRLNESIVQLKELNGLNGEARAKLMVWRKEQEAKGYDFITEDVHVLITLSPFTPKPLFINTADFAESVTFNHSGISPYKTLNRLPQILASRERTVRQLDELIVLNDDGVICECVASNVFWVQDDQFYTPPLSSGCLDGVMRNHVIDRFEQNGLVVNQVLIKPDALLKADAVFATNALGIQIIKQIRTTVYSENALNSIIPLLGL